MPLTSTFGRPGVYLKERPLPRNVPPQGLANAIGVLIGHAESGPMGPQYVASWREFVSTYKGAQIDTTLQRSVYQAFSHGSGPMYVLRMVGAASTHASMSSADAKFFDYEFEAISPGAWGNALTVSITKVNTDPLGIEPGTFTVEISLVGQDYSEIFHGLVDNPTSPNYLPAVINAVGAGSKWVHVVGPAKDQSKMPLALTAGSLADGTVNLIVGLPDQKTTSTQLQGGLTEPTQAADYEEAFARLDELPGELLLYAADASYYPNKGGAAININLAKYAKKRGNSFAILDAPRGLSPTEALGYGVSENDYAAMYYPQVLVQNPAQDAAAGATLMVPPGAAVTGLILGKDRVEGPWSTPAGPNLSLPTAASSRFLGVERLLSNADLDALNTGISPNAISGEPAGSPVNAIRPMANSGITVMGARTRQVATVARYVNVRRTLNHLKVELQNRAAFALFEPITGDLMAEIQVVLNSFLTSVWEAGGLTGAEIPDAFYVVCDSTNNAVETVSQGTLYIDIGLALLIPAEFIVVRVGQFEGGTSASEIDVTR